jgi:hypothetical protein
MNHSPALRRRDEVRARAGHVGETRGVREPDRREVMVSLFIQSCFL